MGTRPEMGTIWKSGQYAVPPSVPFNFLIQFDLIWYILIQFDVIWSNWSIFNFHMQPSRDTDPEEDEDYENDLEVDEDDESWVNFNQKNSIFNKKIGKGVFSKPSGN